MLTTLVALSLLAPQAQGMTLAGRQVPVRFPGPVSTEAPAGFLEWDGWQYGKSRPIPRDRLQHLVEIGFSDVSSALTYQAVLVSIQDIRRGEDHDLHAPRLGILFGLGLSE